MTSFEKVVEIGGNFSEWRQPQRTDYKLGCCDCGLVHDFEFRVVRVIKDLGRGEKVIQEIDDQEQYAVQFRAKRNTRSTGQMRRWKKAEKQ